MHDHRAFRYQRVDISRRGFVLSAMSLPVLAPALLAGSSDPVRATPTATPKSGYHETTHIRTYYDLARY
jgi:hypothetical protein